MTAVTTVPKSLFQSTPPARGATYQRDDNEGQQKFQSTPPARGATNRFHTCSKGLDISIHAPREGGDLYVVAPGSLLF